MRNLAGVAIVIFLAGGQSSWPRAIGGSSGNAARLRTRLGKTWPFVLIGLGLVASIAWIAVLGWLVAQFVELIL